MLEDFSQEQNNVKLLASNQSDVYVCNGTTHYWNENLVWKVADFKNMIIEHAIKEQYDYLFLIDSDLLLYPQTINQLISANKDITSNIFWTKWQPDAEERPQVWLYDEYTQWEISRGQALTDFIRNDFSKFSNEIELRKMQWTETVKSNPEWILNLDADEVFENRFKEEVRQLISDQEVDVYCFRLYDFWNETHYREDEHWRAHQYYRPFLVRYREGFECKWNDRPQHCGRFAENVFELPHKLSDIRLKHLGWVKKEDRMAKFKRYRELDPDGTYGSTEQYQSFLDESPNLVRFEE